MSTLKKFLLFCIIVIAEIIYVYTQSDNIYSKTINYPDYPLNTQNTIVPKTENPTITHFSSLSENIKPTSITVQSNDEKEEILFKLKENISLKKEQTLAKNTLEEKEEQYTNKSVTPIVKIQTQPSGYLGSKSESEEYYALYQEIIETINVPEEKMKN